MPNRKHTIDCNHLLNFKPTAVSSDSQPYQQQPRRQNRNPRRNTKQHDHKTQAAANAEKWTREKLHSSFYLHSSASHSFVVTRSQIDKQKGEDRPRFLRSYSNATGGGGGGNQQKAANHFDSVVHWDAVKLVKVQVPAVSCGNGTGNSENDDGLVDSSLSTCAICLNPFVAPRITKCGHVYCYPCILRHFHVSEGHASKSRDKKSGGYHQHGHGYHRPQDSAAKCPCCFNFILSSEMRPVLFITVQSPSKGIGSNNNSSAAIASTTTTTTNNNNNNNNSHQNSVSMTFHKCHRKRNGYVPFLPFQNTSSDLKRSHHRDDERITIRKRADINDLPSMNNDDAPYSRFNYLEMTALLQHFQNDLCSLQHDLESVTEMYQNFKGRSNVTGDLDLYFITMAIEAVQVENISALSMVDEQTRLQKEQESRYSSMHRIKVVPEYVSMNQEGNAKVVETISSVNCKEKDGQLESTNKLKRRSRANSLHHLAPGTMYLDNDHIHYYQAVDGQLSFLCGLNMKCLAYEYMDKKEMQREQVGTHKMPFPDVIHGQIIDVQSVHLTPEVRKRMPFTSHLPLYIDIKLIELNLTQQLSSSTREHFRSELEQRKKKRHAQRNSDRKAKKKAEREEFERIENLKKGIQRININDDFFQPVVPMLQLQQDEEFVGEGAAFGPSLSSSSRPLRLGQSNVSEVPSSQHNVHRSYGSVCASGGLFPTLDASNVSAFPSLSASSNSDAFPALSSSSSRPQTKKKEVLHTSHQMQTSMVTSKKKSKVVLFSTGGHRGCKK